MSSISAELGQEANGREAARRRTPLLLTHKNQELCELQFAIHSTIRKTPAILLRHFGISFGKYLCKRFAAVSAFSFVWMRADAVSCNFVT